MPIMNKPSEFIEFIHLVDLFQYKSPRVTSAFIFFDGDISVIFDCGTSNDCENVITYMQKSGIPVESVKYIVPTHHHFDHNGGIWKLIKRIRQFNPQAKIFATEQHKSELQNPDRHMKAAASTYGEFVGIMNPPEDDEFFVVMPDEKLYFGNDSSEFSVKLISTPGHTLDHVSPTVFRNGEPYFCFVGEASGTNMNHSKIATLPTSMPIQFDYKQFVKSLDKLIDLKPLNIGLGHFGAITGQSDSIHLLNDQREFIERFRNFCREKYEEKQKTRYLVESALESLFKPRWEYFEEAPEIYKNNVIALCYGMLVDLGYKKNKY
ncbi:MAG: MBL fold metallo-hydrolase [Promethearchaeota archaeon]